jgi:hypothetical protein
MTALTLAMAFAAPALIASMTLAWAVEAWRLGAPGIAAVLAATGAGIAAFVINSILGA